MTDCILSAFAQYLCTHVPCRHLLHTVLEEQCTEDRRTKCTLSPIHSSAQWEWNAPFNNCIGLYFVVHLMNEWGLKYRLSSWLAIISQWGPYWASDVRVHTCPRFRFRLMTEGTYVDWWCQDHHWPSTALINWLLLNMRTVYTFPQKV